MGRLKRLFVLNALATSAALMAGCMSGGQSTALPQSKDSPFALDVPHVDGVVARLQRPDGEPARPPAPPDQPPGLPERPPGPPTGQLMSRPGLPNTKAIQARVSVRAWVNGHPIFDDEVFTEVFFRMAPPKNGGQPDKIIAERFNQALDKLVERELTYQDAMNKLQGNRKVIEKLKQAANKAFDTKIDRMVQANGEETIDSFKEKLRSAGLNLETMRRLEERDYFSNEYIRSRIFPMVQKLTGHTEIRRYYDEHLNEFQSFDRVVWQDIFIAIGPKYATQAQVRTAAQQLAERVRKGEPFESLLNQDDGDNFAFRQGFGYGNRKGEIRPAELEKFLFSLKPGEVGPLVEMPTGIHFFRVLERDNAGQMPFDEKVQAQILNKLRNEVADREYRRIIRDLKERAVIEVNRQTDN